MNTCLARFSTGFLYFFLFRCRGQRGDAQGVFPATYVDRYFVRVPEYKALGGAELPPSTPPPPMTAQ